MLTSDDTEQTIGLFLLSLLPLNSKTPSPLNPTPEVLLQAIDSLIDLYSDEESLYDAAVFRAKGFLGRLESAVGGVRAAVSSRFASLIERRNLADFLSSCLSATMIHMISSTPQTKKIDRKKFPELRSRADGALENLVGFVGYRKEVA